MLWKLVLVAGLSLGLTGCLVVEDPNDEILHVANVYCKGRHAEEKVPEVRDAMKTFVDCLKGLFDLEAIKKEITEAKPTKAYEEIVKKHCAKASQLKACIHTVIPTITPCLPPALFYPEKRAGDLIDFVCDSEGAKITSFLKEDGLQCVNEQVIHFRDCANALASDLRKASEQHGGGADGAMAITKEEACNIEEQEMTCLVGALKNCSNQTPGNLADEVRKKISCVDVNQEA